MSRPTMLERVVLGVAGVVIAIPGILLVFNTEGYVEGKDNLTLTPDLFSELRALGSIFLAAGLCLLVGVFVGRMRTAALVVGAVAYLPQGVARLVSYAVNDGQHGSYLRAGILEVVLGVALMALLARRVRSGELVRAR